MTLRLLSIAILLLQLGPFGGPGQAAENEAADLRLTILANEGLLIRSADTGILIDAFVAVEQSGRNSAVAATVEEMLAGRPPFTSIQLAIVSHPHREHFDPIIAGTFLNNHRETVLASTEEVIQAIRDEYPEYPAIRDRLREITLDGQMTTSMTVSGIMLDFMLFSHEASAFYPERVLTQIIHLAGRKILYVGDSEMLPGNWQPYDLTNQGIDILVIPLWLFKEASVRAIIDEHVAPHDVVVAQIPLGDLETVPVLSGAFPDVVFLSEPMAAAEF